jgi:hypothetical protein
MMVRQYGHFASLVILAVTALGFAGCDKPRGIAAVKELCAKDGGLRVDDTVFVDGYLAPEGTPRCIPCRDYLPKRLFEYVETYLPDGSGYLGDSGPGYYRYTLSTIGDVRCEGSERDPIFRQAKASWGFRENECLAVERLPDRISQFSWKRQQDTLRIDGDIEIARYDFVVFEIDSHRVLARHRDYAFTSKTARFFGSIAAGGANPDLRCHGIGPWSDVRGLLQQVLRDPSKKDTTN